jgi:fumarylacetoacetase
MVGERVEFPNGDRGGNVMNPTNDPALRSWVPIPEGSHFPIQNLPLGVFRRAGEVHCGVAIGADVLDLTVLAHEGTLAPEFLPFVCEDTLNDLLAAGAGLWSPLRSRISQLLRANELTLRDDARVREIALVPQSQVSMLLPVRVGDYTDFYSSRDHAQNVGAMLRGADKALMPNWLYLPVAYHGRASSVVISGTDVVRPCGQSKPEGADTPVFGPTRSLDFELEMAALVGPGNQLGAPIPVARAESHLFGLVLLNDWSARDIQGWEYQPLGPFLGKNFATSISPWIVPLEALEPFRCDGPVQEPTPLPYLRQHGKTSYDIHLEVTLQSAKMSAPQAICRSNFRHLYWSLAQQVAHHTVNGCPLVAGDLLASGTVSGPTPDSLGCLLELSWRGTRLLQLDSGETRRFLEDGDRVTMTAWCQGDGYRVGFGSVSGVVKPATCT